MELAINKDGLLNQNDVFRLGESRNSSSRPAQQCERNCLRKRLKIMTKQRHVHVDNKPKLTIITIRTRVLFEPIELK